MPAAIVARSESTFTIRVEVPYGSSMLDAEEALQQRLNEAGTLATAEVLQRFDAEPAVLDEYHGETSLGLRQEEETSARRADQAPGWCRAGGGLAWR